jgi:hypothetical protein
MLQPSPLKRNLVLRFGTEGVIEKGTHASLWREKLWIVRTNELLGLPCSPLLGMAAPLNLAEVNYSTP